MTKKFFLTLILSAVFSAPAWAYLPPFAMIMSRVADNHGRGIYVIDQDVIYHSDSGNQIIRETWTIADEAHMKVSFAGVGPLKDLIKGSFIYDARNRWAQETGPARAHRLGDNWIEPFFYFRYSKNIKARMVQLKMAPPESLREKPAMRSDGPPNYEAESYVHLDRQRGFVTWAIAKTFSDDSPELWIEQDQFVVTSVRTPDKSVIDADDYAKHDGGMYLARSRSYHWNDKLVTVQVRNVRSIGKSKSRDLFSTSSLTPMQFSGSDLLKEFYLRFR